MPNQQFIPLTPLLTTLGIMLTLSLIVERILTGLSWLMDRLFIVKSSTEWKVPADQKEKLELAKKAKEEEKVLKSSSKNDQDTGEDPREIEPNPKYKTVDSQFEVKMYSLPDSIMTLKEFWLQIIGAVIAIVACYCMKFSVWIFVSQPEKIQNMQEIEPTILGFIITGIIIGAGSKPVHFLMNFLIYRKINISKKEIQTGLQQPLPDALPQLETSKTITVLSKNLQGAPQNIEDIIGFTYDGGDRPERLESTHIRKKSVDLIVYHHTAMHSDSPFEEVVREFDRKGWLTGYHCVVFQDGKIRVLCRWDRFGNHARGHNAHSLGIALHGNFETNPEDRWANLNGKLGIMHPTNAQLDSAARITALWKQLHKIELIFPDKNEPNFPRGIVPHYKLAPKACPGSNFPHDVFKKLILEYTNLWKDDDVFLSALDKFKVTPMVIEKEV